MPRGPILNDISRNFTTRDSVGIEGVAATIQASVCPIVNTVTPRAFYWPFMVWLYYDYHQNIGRDKPDYDSFNNYVKRQDYFFVLANLLIDGSDRSNLVGKLQTERDKEENKEGPYPYNPKYFQSRYGGMQYYNAGCLSLYFITDKDSASNQYYSFPKLSREGEQMALAFREVIKETRYYQQYRLQNRPVPRDVLEEYGRVIRFDLWGFNKCKEILRKHFFEDERTRQLSERSRTLRESRDYILLLVNQAHLQNVSGVDLRRALYDFRSPDGASIILPEDLKTVANKWEIVIGRQYFTIGLEMIWKQMLEQLNEPMTGNEWLNIVLGASSFSIDLQSPLSDVSGAAPLTFDRMEEMVADARHGRKMENSLENGLRIMLSVYDRFHKRDDFGEEKAFLWYGNESRSISLQELFDKVEEYKGKTVLTFLAFLMRKWLIEQHYFTAFEKMMQNRDGFYYEFINGRYVRKFKFGLDFQAIRLTSLTQVMRDLDIL